MDFFVCLFSNLAGNLAKSFGPVDCNAVRYDVASRHISMSVDIIVASPNVESFATNTLHRIISQ